ARSDAPATCQQTTGQCLDTSASPSGVCSGSRIAPVGQCRPIGFSRRYHRSASVGHVGAKQVDLCDTSAKARFGISSWVQVGAWRMAEPIVNVRAAIVGQTEYLAARPTASASPGTSQNANRGYRSDGATTQGPTSARPAVRTTAITRRSQV